LLPYSPGFPLPPGEVAGISHLREVSDVHTDVIHCAIAAITVGVESFEPKLNPLIVSITPEQVGKFSELAPLITGASKEKSRTAVPTMAETIAEMVSPGFEEA
jgi:hypothetical protein